MRMLNTTALLVLSFVLLATGTPILESRNIFDCPECPAYLKELLSNYREFLELTSAANQAGDEDASSPLQKEASNEDTAESSPDSPATLEDYAQGCEVMENDLNEANETTYNEDQSTEATDIIKKPITKEEDDSEGNDIEEILIRKRRSIADNSLTMNDSSEFENHEPSNENKDSSESGIVAETETLASTDAEKFFYVIFLFDNKSENEIN